MPELESPCDSGSKALFQKRSFTLQHRFAIDSRVPASSCVQILPHCKVASNRVTAVLQPIEHVGHSVFDRKSPKDSISGIYISFRGPQHVRFLSVRSKLQQISWEGKVAGSARGIWGTPLYTQNQPGEPTRGQ